MRTAVLLFTLFFSIHLTVAQPSIRLPLPLTVTVNDSIYATSSSFVDTLELLLENSDFYYHIAGANDDGIDAYTTLRLPQTLKMSDIIKQIVLYYNFIPDESAREREQLAIYPFFKSLSHQPDISCRYLKGGAIRIENMNWNVVPVPPAPTPEDKSIYNEIIDLSMEQSNTLDEASDEVIEAVALKHTMDFTAVKYLYQQILLWQRSPWILKQ